MKNRLAWACGGIVALAVLIRLAVGGLSTEQNRTRSASLPSARPAQASSSDSNASTSGGAPWKGPLLPSSHKRLKDEALPMPPKEASGQEKREYLEGLQAIQKWRDPITGEPLDPKAMAQKERERLKSLQEQAVKRLQQAQADLSFRIEQRRIEHRERLIQAGLNPDVPGPQLFPPPEPEPAGGEFDPQTGLKRE